MRTATATEVGTESVLVFILKSIAGAAEPQWGRGFLSGFSFDADDIAELPAAVAAKWEASGIAKILGPTEKRDQRLLAAARVEFKKFSEHGELRAAEQKLEHVRERESVLTAKLRELDEEFAGLRRSLDGQVGELLAGTAEEVAARLGQPEFLAARERTLTKERSEARGELALIQRARATAEAEAVRTRRTAVRSVGLLLRPAVAAAVGAYVSVLLRAKEHEAALREFKRVFEGEVGEPVPLPPSVFGRTQGLAALLSDLQEMGLAELTE